MLNDNAAPHKVKVTMTFLEGRKIRGLAHIPYSPYLAPCDFWFFPILQEKLEGHKFNPMQDLVKPVKSQPEGIPREQYDMAF